MTLGEFEFDELWTNSHPEDGRSKHFSISMILNYFSFTPPHHRQSIKIIVGSKSQFSCLISITTMIIIVFTIISPIILISNIISLIILISNIISPMKLISNIISPMILISNIIILFSVPCSAMGTLATLRCSYSFSSLSSAPSPWSARSDFVFLIIAKT